MLDVREYPKDSLETVVENWAGRECSGIQATAIQRWSARMCERFREARNVSTNYRGQLWGRLEAMSRATRKGNQQSMEVGSTPIVV